MSNKTEFINLLNNYFKNNKINLQITEIELNWVQERIESTLGEKIFLDDNFTCYGFYNDENFSYGNLLIENYDDKIYLKMYFNKDHMQDIVVTLNI